MEGSGSTEEMSSDTEMADATSRLAFSGDKPNKGRPPVLGDDEDDDDDEVEFLSRSRDGFGRVPPHRRDHGVREEDFAIVDGLPRPSRPPPHETVRVTVDSGRLPRPRRHHVPRRSREHPSGGRRSDRRRDEDIGSQTERINAHCDYVAKLTEKLKTARGKLQRDQRLLDDFLSSRTSSSASTDSISLRTKVAELSEKMRTVLHDSAFTFSTDVVSADSSGALMSSSSSGSVPIPSGSKSAMSGSAMRGGVDAIDLIESDDDDDSDAAMAAALAKKDEEEYAATMAARDEDYARQLQEQFDREEAHRIGRSDGRAHGRSHDRGHVVGDSRRTQSSEYVISDEQRALADARKRERERHDRMHAEEVRRLEDRQRARQQREADRRQRDGDRRRRDRRDGFDMFREIERMGFGGEDEDDERPEHIYRRIYGGGGGGRLMAMMQDDFVFGPGGSRIMFGPGALRMHGMDDMDYEEMMAMFPPETRGAEVETIQQLPEDVFRKKAAEASGSGKDEADIDDEKFRESDPLLSAAASSAKASSSSVSGAAKIHSPEEACCICLLPFEEGDKIRRLPCLHIFHTEEIDKWLVINHICPICRVPIEADEHQAMGF